ncbi:hypothetical protein BHJ80_24310 [Escherichia coli]|nr:hypothetical protein BHJ80_24310 [Escherichia coli]
MVYKMRYRSQHPYSIKEKQMKSEVLSVKEKNWLHVGRPNKTLYSSINRAKYRAMVLYTDDGYPAIKSETTKPE